MKFLVEQDWPPMWVRNLLEVCLGWVILIVLCTLLKNFVTHMVYSIAIPSVDCMCIVHLFCSVRSEVISWEECLCFLRCAIRGYGSAYVAHTGCLKAENLCNSHSSSKTVYLPVCWW